MRDPTNLTQALEVPAFSHSIVDNNTYATAVCVGDVDRDGSSDVIAGKDEVGVSWYKYPNWENYTIGAFNWQSEEIRCADIDGDGYLDVVGADSNHNLYWFQNPLPNGSVTNLWTRHYIGNCSYYIWGGLGIVDFNNDGKLDVVVRADAYYNKDEITVFLQNDNASSWNPVKTIYTHHSFDVLDVGDLNGDSHPDIVCNGFWLENPYPDLSSNWTENNIDSKWWNQTTGSWTDNNARVVVADLNKDGKLDVLFSQSEAPGFPVSWYETSNPETGPWVEHKIGYVDNCHTLLVGDLNYDGYLDVVAAKFPRSDGLIPPPYPIIVYYNNGNCLSWNETTVSDLGIYKATLGNIGGHLAIVGSHGYLISPIEMWTSSLSPTPTPLPTLVPTLTPTPTSDPTLTLIPSPTLTSPPDPTPILTPTDDPTPGVSPTPSPTPSSQPESTPTPSVKPVSTPNPTVAPTAPQQTPKATLDPTPTTKPSSTPTPSLQPTNSFFPSPIQTNTTAAWPQNVFFGAGFIMVLVVVVTIVIKRQKKSL
jgi:hypothetical protein